MTGVDELWVAECTVCCSQFSSYKEYRADDWADSHTDETGHKTTVTMELDV